MKSLAPILLAALVAVAALAGGAGDSLVFSWQGYYASSAEGRPEVADVAEVDLLPAYEGQAMYIDFMTRRASTDGVLGAVCPAYGMTRKTFSFSFTDGWGNDGRGTFSRHGEKFVLHLEILRASPSGAVARGLYGDYELVKKEGKGRADRHPWSLGRRPAGTVPPSPSATSSPPAK